MSHPLMHDRYAPVAMEVDVSSANTQRRKRTFDEVDDPDDGVILKPVTKIPKSEAIPVRNEYEEAVLALRNKPKKKRSYKPRSKKKKTKKKKKPKKKTKKKTKKKIKKKTKKKAKRKGKKKGKMTPEMRKVRKKQKEQQKAAIQKKKENHANRKLLQQAAASLYTA